MQIKVVRCFLYEACLLAGRWGYDDRMGNSIDNSMTEQASTEEAVRKPTDALGESRQQIEQLNQRMERLKSQLDQQNSPLQKYKWTIIGALVGVLLVVVIGLL